MKRMEDDYKDLILRAMRRTRAKARYSDESKRLAEERSTLTDLLDQKGPKGIKYSQVIRKIKPAQNVKFSDEPPKVHKILAVTMSKAKASI
uniref:Uncharacterized protein n=1 Tax=Megaselia scalaris TaxID=36166 RepID=T1GK61_MEGSC